MTGGFVELTAPPAALLHHQLTLSSVSAMVAWEDQADRGRIRR
jgi:hypothetical protein